MDNSIDRSALQQEWLLLQQQTERQERSCLLVKLSALALIVLSYSEAAWLLTTTLVLLAWGMEAMLRTQQARTVARVLVVEAALRAETEHSATEIVPMQFNSAWQAHRGGITALLSEYVGHSLKPTVFYPYLPLALVCSLLRFLS